MMTKLAVFTNSFMVIGVSALSIHSDSYYLQVLFNTTLPYAVLRTVLICAILAYCLNPSLRTMSMRKLLGFTGVLLFIGSIVTFVSPTLFGSSPVFYPIGDTFLFSQMGLWATVVAYEMPVTKARYALPKLRLRVPATARTALSNR